MSCRMPRTNIALALLLATILPAACSRAAEAVPLTQNTHALGSIVIPGGSSDPLLIKAAAVIQDTVRRWSGAELPVTRRTAAAESGAGEAIVLSTLDSLRTSDPAAESASAALGKVAFLDDQGFACAPVTRNGRRQVYVVGKTPRGVFNGATYLKNYLLDGPKDGLTLREEEVVKSPEMKARGTYCLSIYGVVPQYTVKDWKRIFDSFARDGMERVYFWTSGHFPSQKFPQTYNRDATTGTHIGTVKDLRELIRYAHSLGIKFYLGSGVFAWANAAYLTEGHPETAAVKAGGLCPSNPLVRQRTHDYFVEMIDALPEADGFFLEMRDEQGECQCPVCQKPVDNLGSKQYGQSEITFLQELARDVWRKHPHAHFCWNIGYAEHKDDVAYYRQMRLMSDPRFEWLDCRYSWTLPGPGGERLPLVYFSKNSIHWGPFYSRPLDEMVAMCTRIAHDGLIGYVPAFEPGFATADYYGQEIPYATSRVPYVVTGAVYRELTWEPTLKAEQLQDRLRARFFGAEAPADMGKVLWGLRDWVVANAAALTKYSQDWISYDTRRVPHSTLAQDIEKAGTPTAKVGEKGNSKVKSADAAATAALLQTVRKLKAIRDEGLPMLAQVEQEVQQARAGASPKSLETLALMQRVIDDTRRNYALAVPNPAALDEYETRLASLAHQASAAE